MGRRDGISVFRAEEAPNLEFRYACSFDPNIAEGSEDYAAILATAAQSLPMWKTMTEPLRR